MITRIMIESTSNLYSGLYKYEVVGLHKIYSAKFLEKIPSLYRQSKKYEN